MRLFDTPSAQEASRPPRGARVLPWSDLAKVGTLPSGTYWAGPDGTLYRGIPQRGYLSPAWDEADTVALEDEGHHAAILQEEQPARLLAELGMLAERAAITSPRHRPRESRPVSHVYTLSSLLRRFDDEGATLVDRGGRALLLVPVQSGSSLTHADVRHAMEALAPLLDGQAAGQPVSCAEPGCGKDADTILFPAFPACTRHAVISAPPEEQPERLPYWKVPKVTITPAGARLLGLGQPKAAQADTPTPALARPRAAVARLRPATR